jgi:hypothetical protein
VTEKSTGQPANIAEFNTIVGLVFAQLYERFPIAIESLDRDKIASAMNVPPGEWSTYLLPSGRPFTEVLGHSLTWLSDEGYLRSRGSTTYQLVALTQKGLATMNAVPQGLSASVGTSLVMAAGGSGQNWSGIGDLVGGVIGGFTKSMGGS